MSVQEEMAKLRANGYTVRVHHVRQFQNVAAETAQGLDCMLTRGEFDRSVQNGTLVFVDGENRYEAEGDECLFGKQVSPNGGFTSVTIEKDGVTVAKGKRNFSREQFNKRIGIAAAFGRAVKQMK